MGMKKVFSIAEAKAQFSKLLRRAAAGEEITITKWGVPVARLVPIRKKGCGSVNWGGRRGLNPRHSVPQTDALPAELLPPQLDISLR